MKLDDFGEDAKVSLDVTPLLDVVFLLVLFFAVATSLISPKALHDLKANLGTLRLERSALTAQVTQFKGDIARKREELARLHEHSAALQQELQAIAARRRAEVGNLHARLLASAARTKKLRWEIEALQGQKTGLTKTLARNRERNQSLQQQLDQAYRDFQSLKVELDVSRLDARERARREKTVLLRLAREVERADTLAQQIGKLQKSSARQDAQDRLLRALVAERAARISKLQATVQVSAKQARALAAQLAAQKNARTDAESKTRLLQALLARKVAAFDDLAVKLASADTENRALGAKLGALDAAVGDDRRQLAQAQARAAGLDRELAGYRRAEHLSAAELARVLSTQRRLRTGLAGYLEKNQIGIRREDQRLILQLSDRILFPSGSARINAQGLAVLRQVGELLKERAGTLDIRVAGYTDDVPVAGGGAGAFRDNWDLSAARAVRVVEFLQDQVGIDPARLSAVGYGQYHPVASNETVAGRALNRRIELVLVPAHGTSKEAARTARCGPKRRRCG